MKKLLVPILSLIMLCGALCITPAAAANETGEIDHGGIELPLPKGLQVLENMLVTVRDGFVCVTDKDGTLIYMTDISAESLREADRLLLEEGIAVTDLSALIRIMEDYNS